MTILTGANGWLGLAVAQALADSTAAEIGLQVGPTRGLVLKGTGTSALKSVNPAMQIIEGNAASGAGISDLFPAEARGGVLIHTVGVIHPRRVADFYAVNVEGTRKVLQAAAQAGIRRAVVVSSNSPCGCNPHPDHLFDEESDFNPYMNYGKSKMQMEMLCRDIHHRGDLEVVIIRAPWFYGPHQPPRQRLFFEMIRDGKAPIVGDGENLRSMAYTENLAQGLLRAAAVPAAAGETYWIADERPYSMNEIVDTIERLLENEFGQKCAHKRMRLPGVASEVALVLDASLQALGLYQQKIHVLSEMNKTIACAVDKAKRELGYSPKVALEEGMRRSLAEMFGARTL